DPAACEAPGMDRPTGAEMAAERARSGGSLQIEDVIEPRPRGSTRERFHLRASPQMRHVRIALEHGKEALLGGDRDRTRLDLIEHTDEPGREDDVAERVIPDQEGRGSVRPL